MKKKDERLITTTITIPAWMYQTLRSEATRRKAKAERSASVSSLIREHVNKSLEAR